MNGKASASSNLYQKIVRPVLFRFDPENVHEWVLKQGGRAARLPFVGRCLQGFYDFDDARLATEVFGCSFRNPFGLAAGFDKNCIAPELFAALGFSHIEFGTITAKPQPGNPRPRIFRLPADQALINRMGFPSEGAEVVAERLAALRRGPFKPRIGVNFGKTKAVAVDDALQDYLESFRKLSTLGDYFVLNVSSPNTPELRKLQEPARLKELFLGVNAINAGQRPLLIKIAPDLEPAEVDGILEVALQCKVSGLIATNTTIGREKLRTASLESGGLSGAPLKEKSLHMVSHIYKSTNGQLPIVGVGGIACLSDVLAMFAAGASLVQLYTGFIYGGPNLIFRLQKELAAFLEANGLKSVRQLVGQSSSSVYK